MARYCAIKIDGVGSVLVKSKFRWPVFFSQHCVLPAAEIMHRNSDLGLKLFDKLKRVHGDVLALIWPFERDWLFLLFLGQQRFAANQQFSGPFVGCYFQSEFFENSNSRLDLQSGLKK